MVKNSTNSQTRKLGLEVLESRNLMAIDLVSTVAGSNVATGIGASGLDISDDGRYVAYIAPANGTLARSAIVVKDVQTGTTKIASASSTGALAYPLEASFFGNEELQMSSDGRYVAFAVTAPQSPPLIPGDSGDRGIFVKDLQTGILSRVPLPSNGGNLPGYYALSDDGRSFLFEEDDVAGGVSIGKRLSRIDLVTNATTTITPTLPYFEQIRVRGNGRYILFNSAGDFVGFNTRNVYLKDLVTGVITKVDTNATGQAGNGISGTGLSDISADGRYVAFTSDATNLVPGTFADSINVFVKDLQTGAVRVASSDGLGDFSRLNFSIGDVSISADGRFVSFAATNHFLVAGTLGEEYLREGYVKDLLTGAIHRVTSNIDGFQTNGLTYSIELSRNGQFVSFVDTGVYAGIDSNGSSDVFRANVGFANSLVSEFHLTGVPTTWAFNETKVYNVTVTNRGSATWQNSGANPVNLGIYFNGLSDAAYHWESEPIRAALPHSVAPGQSVTIQVTIKAPTQPGNYVLRHRMVQEHRAWFAQIGKVQPTFQFKASYDNQAPAVMTPGQTRSFTVNVTNTSGVVWRASGANPVQLGVYDSGRSDAIYDWTREPTRYALASDVQSGQSATFLVRYTAPTIGSSVVLRARMVTEHVAWFQEVSTKTIEIGLLSASISGAPSSISTGPGIPISYNVTITNTGTVNWGTEGLNRVQLGVYLLPSNGIDTVPDFVVQPLRIPLPFTIRPGQSVTLLVNFNRIPLTPGTYILRNRLVMENIAWFDNQASSNVLVNLPS